MARDMIAAQDPLAALDVRPAIALLFTDIKLSEANGLELVAPDHEWVR
jgi:hypothetical protein